MHATCLTMSTIADLIYRWSPRELKEYLMSLTKTDDEIGTHSTLFTEILINDQELKMDMEFPNILLIMPKVFERELAY